jgi:hypothetical protein
MVPFPISTGTRLLFTIVTTRLDYPLQWGLSVNCQELPLAVEIVVFIVVQLLKRSIYPHTVSFSSMRKSPKV